MSVKFNVVARGNPSNKAAAKKFYASVVSTGKLDQNEVAQSAAEMSTLSSGDTAAAVENFLHVITRELAKGNIVQLGDFGSFWIRTESDGKESADDVRGDSITNVLPLFKPGKRFQQALDAIVFEKASKAGE
jgi:predicted histone-like DNA-binding protein